MYFPKQLESQTQQSKAVFQSWGSFFLG